MQNGLGVGVSLAYVMPEVYHQYIVFSELYFVNFRFMYFLLNDFLNLVKPQQRVGLVHSSSWKKMWYKCFEAALFNDIGQILKEKYEVVAHIDLIYIYLINYFVSFFCRFDDINRVGSVHKQIYWTGSFILVVVWCRLVSGGHVYYQHHFALCRQVRQHFMILVRF